MPRMVGVEKRLLPQSGVERFHELGAYPTPEALHRPAGVLDIDVVQRRRVRLKGNPAVLQHLVVGVPGYQDARPLQDLIDHSSLLGKVEVVDHMAEGRAGPPVLPVDSPVIAEPGLVDEGDVFLCGEV